MKKEAPIAKATTSTAGNAHCSGPLPVKANAIV
ncbi:hypothetical protein LPJGGPFB_01506 [Ensifer adhaerens]|nr:hypothetical protein [Ensifer adhaerens]